MPSTYQIRLPVFEGPLDLLLHIIERQELDITTVALAQVTNQYLSHIKKLQLRAARDLTAFLVVAAKLMLIKSQALLPRPPAQTPESATEDRQLVNQLKLYKRFKQAATLLREREIQGLHSHLRMASPARLPPQPDLGNTTPDDLLAFVQEALNTLPASPVSDVVPPLTLTVDDQIALIQEVLRARRQVYFRDILSKASTRPEAIATLLAVLELVKRDLVTVWQEHLFGAITIERVRSAQGSEQRVTDPATNRTT